MPPGMQPFGLRIFLAEVQNAPGALRALSEAGGSFHVPVFLARAQTGGHGEQGQVLLVAFGAQHP
jgi:hypothetical protein